MIIVLILLIIALVLYHKFFKNYDFGSVNLIDGSVKGGKTALSVSGAIRVHRKELFKWYLQYAFWSIINKKNRNNYKPLLISNIPIRSKFFAPLTKDILLREIRIPNHSVCVLDEASLVADSMLYKDKVLNEKIMLFIKLWGHYSHNGTLIINTQSPNDLHFNFKRSLAKTLFIHSKIKLPFITILKVVEERFSDGSGSTQIYDQDVEDATKRLIIFNRVYKKYDYICYSVLTDNLNMYYDYRDTSKLKRKELKQKDIVSFNDFKTL